MRFGLLGGIVQFHPGSEGYLLRRAGLLKAEGTVETAEYLPTPLLRSLFTDMPELEELYPVLVEFVMIFRYLDTPGFVDAEEVVRRLIGLGITAEGLTMLTKLVTYMIQRI